MKPRKRTSSYQKLKERLAEAKHRIAYLDSQCRLLAKGHYYTTQKWLARIKLEADMESGALIGVRTKKVKTAGGILNMVKGAKKCR